VRYNSGVKRFRLIHRLGVIPAISLALFVPLYAIRMIGLPEIHIGQFVVYAGDDGYLQILWAGVHYREVNFNLRPIVAGLLVIAIFPFFRGMIARSRAFPKGHCRVCGYDMRATPDQCPECGTIPPKKEVISN
jgi:hypothetical protein